MLSIYYVCRYGFQTGKREYLPVLFSLLKLGDRYGELSIDEFHSLFSEYYKPIRNFIYFRCGDTNLAEDIAQDVFVKLWETRLRIDRRTVKAYLYTIAQNLTINQIKRRKLHFEFIKKSGNDRDFDTPEKLAEIAQYEQRLMAVLEQLPAGGREVFLMNRLEDLTYNEIAARLELSVKAVEKRMSKVLKILRDKLGVEI
ncbi:MAG: RNA polymerase sigma-70 factor [Crocinitomicaceae bacterium]|nr:RNA polymerase sigma-70 factor [Crocinitomicaceae bacterium]